MTDERLEETKEALTKAILDASQIHFLMNSYEASIRT